MRQQQMSKAGRFHPACAQHGRGNLVLFETGDQRVHALGKQARFHSPATRNGQNSEQSCYFIQLLPEYLENNEDIDKDNSCSTPLQAQKSWIPVQNLATIPRVHIMSPRLDGDSLMTEQT
jgi:hypothetical protein